MMPIPNFILVGILIFAVMSWVVMIWGQCRKPSPKFEATSVIVSASIIACTISFVSIWIALPVLNDCNGAPNYDHQDVIVGIFSLLVTLLIGWNVYTVIDYGKRVELAERKYDELNAKQEEDEQQMEKRKACLNEAIADLYNHILFENSYNNTNAFAQYIMHVLNSIVIRSKLGEYQKCSSTINTFLSDKDDFNRYILSQEVRDKMKELFNLISKRNEIANFDELEECIISIRNR